MPKIIHIADRLKDGTLWNVQDMLRDALKDYESGENKYPKGFLVLLDDSDLQYDTH